MLGLHGTTSEMKWNKIISR